MVVRTGNGHENICASRVGLVLRRLHGVPARPLGAGVAWTSCKFLLNKTSLNFAAGRYIVDVIA